MSRFISKMNTVGTCAIHISALANFGSEIKPKLILRMCDTQNLYEYIYTCTYDKINGLIYLVCTSIMNKTKHSVLLRIFVFPDRNRWPQP